MSTRTSDFQLWYLLGLELSAGCYLEGNEQLETLEA